MDQIGGMIEPHSFIHAASKIPWPPFCRSSVSGASSVVSWPCTLRKNECGHRRQRPSMEFGVWPETAIRPIPHRLSSSKIGSRAGCSGWKARHRTGLAVQQQRFDNRQQCW